MHRTLHRHQRSFTQMTGALLLYTATAKTGANYWQCDANFLGTNANLVRVFIFGRDPTLHQVLFFTLSAIPVCISHVQLLSYAMHSWHIGTMRRALLTKEVASACTFLLSTLVALQCANVEIVARNQPRLFQWTLGIVCAQLCVGF